MTKGKILLQYYLQLSVKYFEIIFNTKSISQSISDTDDNF